MGSPLSNEFFKILLLLVLPCMTVSCIDYNPIEEEDFGYSSSDRGVFIVNEGNFMYGNASLSYYDIDAGNIENEAFSRINGMSLGDVAQSMSINGNKGYIVVNNSGIVFVVDINTLDVTGTITGLVSPRYIHFGDNKAYITDLYSGTIAVVNTQTNKVINHIEIPGHQSTESMVQYDNYLFVNCWSYDNSIFVIDTQLDAIVDSIKVGFQPKSMTIDKNNKIWVSTEGHVAGGITSSTYSLFKIDAPTRLIDEVFKLPSSSSSLMLAMNGMRDTLFYINNHIWRMCVDDDSLPTSPFISNNEGTIFYGLGVDRETSEVYVADAIDYVQPGVVYRFDANASPLDTFKTGIIPGNFCFRYRE